MNFYEVSAAAVVPTEYRSVERNGHGVILIHGVYYYYSEFRFRTVLGGPSTISLS